MTGRGQSGGNGNSVNGGPGSPVWLRHGREYAEVRAYQYSSWTVGPA